MALVEGCKHRLEITVPVAEVERETSRAVEALRAKTKLPGFRPGKVPASIIRSRFASDIRQKVLEVLIPRYLRQEVENANLDIVGTPDVRDVKLEKGEPLVFTAEFEVMPEVELGEYYGLEIPYEEPEVTEEDVAKRLDELREQKADYINVDPRPVEAGDYAVVALESIAGVDGKPIKNDEMMLHIGDEETLSDFSKGLIGMEPEQEKEIDVTYPEDYGEPRLLGKTVRFRVELKAIRKKELPQLDDDFAEDLGDFKNLDELKDTVRSAIRGEREYLARQEAQNAAVEVLVDNHDFPVPEAFVDGQIQSNVEIRTRELVAQGIDPKNIKLDWEKVRESQKDRALREVKASILLRKVAERESIEVMQDEVDQQVQRVAQSRREPVVAVRKQLEESGEIRRIASRIRTDKTLSFLFEHAKKVAKKKEKDSPADSV